jgi:phosphosulfolactate synthase (CoM biosynthesis protein A)
MKMKFIFDDFFRYVFAVRVDTININNGKYSIPMEYKRCNLIRRVDSGQEELK